MYIINQGEIADLKATGDTVFIDARGGVDAYERFCNGHLEDAFFVDLENDISEKSDDPIVGGRHPLPTPQKFGKLLGSLGIMPSTTVVVYDDKRGANAAARFWWMMRAAGHEKIFVINGGFEAIVASGLSLSTDELELLSEFPAYPIINWEMPLVDINQVALAADDSNKLIIDVRENYRYRGESEPIDLVAGHIPGAINIPYTDVIVHCGSGVTACHTLLALAEAGIPGASLYVGSWSEWSRNDRRIATGDENS